MYIFTDIRWPFEPFSYETSWLCQVNLVCSSYGMFHLHCVSKHFFGKSDKFFDFLSGNANAVLQINIFHLAGNCKADL